MRGGWPEATGLTLLTQGLLIFFSSEAMFFQKTSDFACETNAEAWMSPRET